MSDDHALNHAHNNEFENELEALVKRYLERDGTCGWSMVEALNFYAYEIASACNPSAFDLMMASMLRSAGRLM